MYNFVWTYLFEDLNEVMSKVAAESAREAAAIKVTPPKPKKEKLEFEHNVSLICDFLLNKFNVSNFRKIRK